MILLSEGFVLVAIAKTTFAEGERFLIRRAQASRDKKWGTGIVLDVCICSRCVCGLEMEEIRPVSAERGERGGVATKYWIEGILQ